MAKHKWVKAQAPISAKTLEKETNTQAPRNGKIADRPELHANLIHHRAEKMYQKKVVADG